MEAKCAELRAEARRMVSSIKSNFGVEMMKIPKKIRSMPLSEFMTECGGDLSAVLARDRSRALASRPAASSRFAATTRKARPGMRAGATVKVRCADVPVRRLRHQPRHFLCATQRPRGKAAGAPSTPGGAAVTGRVRGPISTPSTTSSALKPHMGTSSKALHVTGAPCTPSVRATARAARCARLPLSGPLSPLSQMARQPRKGEAIMSVRGSPLGAFASTQVALASAAASTASVTAALDSAGGSVVQLADSTSAGQLSAAEKEEAANKIASLQAQLSQLMSALQ